MSKKTRILTLSTVTLGLLTAISSCTVVPKPYDPFGQSSSTSGNAVPPGPGSSSSSAPVDLSTSTTVHTFLRIDNGETASLKVGEILKLKVIHQGLKDPIGFSSSDGNVASVDADGNVVALQEGKTTISAISGTLSDSLLLTVSPADPLPPPTPDPGPAPEPNPDPTPNPGGNPYIGMGKQEFYATYKPAASHQDSLYRTECHFMSGDIAVPGQEPSVAMGQPAINGKLVHNSNLGFSENNNVYTVPFADGTPAFSVYKGGAYTSLEEVAAYIYAWGDIPANYDKNKRALPTNSPWGEYLRVNNNAFSGDNTRYQFEPSLPRISGCGGDLAYKEIDIGTTGTDCSPTHPAAIYNDGTKIVRGAARIVYSCTYVATGKPVAPEDRYVFYTYNHYNDFQEYLNYKNGWGKMFGNITGGGVLSSSNPAECKPTPYVPVVRQAL